MAAAAAVMLQCQRCCLQPQLGRHRQPSRDLRRQMSRLMATAMAGGVCRSLGGPAALAAAAASLGGLPCPRQACCLCRFRCRRRRCDVAHPQGRDSPSQPRTWQWPLPPLLLPTSRPPLPLLRQPSHVDVGGHHPLQTARRPGVTSRAAPVAIGLSAETDTAGR